MSNMTIDLSAANRNLPAAVSSDELGKVGKWNDITLRVGEARIKLADIKSGVSGYYFQGFRSVKTQASKYQESMTNLRDTLGSLQTGDVAGNLTSLLGSLKTAVRRAQLQSKPHFWSSAKGNDEIAARLINDLTPALNNLNAASIKALREMFAATGSGALQQFLGTVGGNAPKIISAVLEKIDVISGERSAKLETVAPVLKAPAGWRAECDETCEKLVDLLTRDPETVSADDLSAVVKKAGELLDNPKKFNLYVYKDEVKESVCEPRDERAASDEVDSEILERYAQHTVAKVLDKFKGTVTGAELRAKYKASDFYKKDSQTGVMPLLKKAGCMELTDAQARCLDVFCSWTNILFGYESISTSGDNKVGKHAMLVDKALKDTLFEAEV